MPDPILGRSEPDAAIYERIGKVAAEWSWIETLLGEMLSNLCSADPGAMYVITQNASNATLVDWVRTLIHIRVSEPEPSKVILDLLTEIDEARAERNTIVHGTWRGADDPSIGRVQTFNWQRADVARTEIWSTADLDDLITHMHHLQLKLANLGITMGFLHLEKT